MSRNPTDEILYDGLGNRTTLLKAGLAPKAGRDREIRNVRFRRDCIAKLENAASNKILAKVSLSPVLVGSARPNASGFSKDGVVPDAMQAASLQGHERDPAAPWRRQGPRDHRERQALARGLVTKVD